MAVRRWGHGECSSVVWTFLLVPKEGAPGLPYQPAQTGGRGKREGGLRLKRWLQSSIRTRDRFFLLWKLSWEKSVFSGWKCKLTSHIILMIYFMGGESFPLHCSRPQRLSLTWATTYFSNLLFHFLLLRTNPRPHGIMSSALQLCILGHALVPEASSHFIFRCES